MKYLLLLFVILATVSERAYGLDYEAFSSIEEVIEHESKAIENLDPLDYENLSKAYLDRGESYFVGAKYDLALTDFQTAYETAEHCNQSDQPKLFFSAFLGMGMSYGALDMMECSGALICAQNMLDSITSGSCQKSYAGRLSNQTAAPYQPILGPDNISVGECRGNALGTARRGRELISLVTRAEWQGMLYHLIDALEGSALNCCNKGRMWKDCLQPLVNRVHQWNEKYKVLGVLPNPYWE